MKNRNLAIMAGLAALPLLAPTNAKANVVAYYQFTGAPGTKVPTTADSTAPATNPVIDSSGNGNNMKTYSNTSGFVYQTNTDPNASVANSPDMGVFSGAMEDVYSQGASLGNTSFAGGFTFEASVNFAAFVNPVTNDGYQTFLTQQIDTSGSSPLAALYFQKTANNDLAVQIQDTSNTTRNITDPTAISLNTWYNLAAVDNRSQMSLYVQTPNASNTNPYVLIGSTATSGGMIFNNRNFDIGSGWYNNGATDWVDGSIADVRISNNALAPSQFLFASAAPEPSEFGLLAFFSLGLGGLMLRANRRKAVPA